MHRSPRIRGHPRLARPPPRPRSARLVRPPRKTLDEDSDDASSFLAQLLRRQRPRLTAPTAPSRATPASPTKPDEDWLLNPNLSIVTR